MQHPLVVIVGPTGSGKTALSIRLALEFQGEIVNADSRQVYRGMDIGTAKPSISEMSLVPHHLFDIIEPDAEFSLTLYQERAKEAIAALHRRSKIPFLTGGSGQYIWALLEGWQVPPVSPDYNLRADLEKQAAAEGSDLYRKLQELDAEAAAGIDPRNIRRVIRALEVCQLSGSRFSRLKTRNPPDYDSLIIGLTGERSEIYRRTDLRVIEMFKTGLMAETERLLKQGYSERLPSLSSIGYRQCAAVLRGEMTEEEAIKNIQTETHRYIRHQYAWFRLSDRRIHWFDITREIYPEIQALVKKFLAPA